MLLQLRLLRLRASNGEKTRYCVQPREMARIAVGEADRNRRGVFLTSAIYKNADYTEELIVETLRIMREELRYPGYIHAKVMPGTDPLLIEKAGRYADRLSVNIEVAKSEGYAKIAKQKTRDNILSPMAAISRLIRANREEKSPFKPAFATSQTTQLMAGSTDEDDRTILTLSSALYRKYRLGRVYYTAFRYRHPAAGYDLPLVSTPVWRVGRLYQADRLLQLYGFTPDEILPPEHASLSLDLDPKTDWALRNPQFFPVEVNRAPYESLVRVPGIGDVYARRILQARRLGSLDRDALVRLGIPMKKCLYFITCRGQYAGGRMLERPDLLRRAWRPRPLPPANSCVLKTVWSPCRTRRPQNSRTGARVPSRQPEQPFPLVRTAGRPSKNRPSGGSLRMAGFWVLPLL